MDDAPDHELLQRYAHQRSEEAFAALVARHVDLVYSAALRQVRGSHLAEEVAQQVFVELARQAAHMKPDTLLAAWLHAATRRRAIDAVRGETRRRHREQVALDLAEADAPDASWTQVAPQLDSALQSLGAPEREALLLRYFENKSLREVGAALGISDDAAQKRVHRALERLRTHFARRRIPLGAAGLATLLSTQAVQAAPAGLAATLATAALIPGAGLAALGHTLAMTTLQKSLVASALALSLGLGVYETDRAARLEHLLQAGEQAEAQTRLATTRRLAALTDENARLRAEAERLHAEALAARQAQSDDTATAQDPSLRAMAEWLERVQTLKARFKTHPEAATPGMQWLDEEDWLAAAKNNPLADENDFRRAASQLRSSADSLFANKAVPALQAYLKAHGDVFPTDIFQLQPYFESPLDPAILQRWVVKPAKEVRNIKVGGDWVITQKNTVDVEMDQTNAIGAHGFGSTSNSLDTDTPKLKAILAAFDAANPGREPAGISELLPYATTAEQKAVLQKAIAAQRTRAP